MTKQKKKYITFIYLLLVFQLSFSQNKVNFKLNLHEEDEYIITYKLLSSSEQEVYGEPQIVKKEIEHKYHLRIIQATKDSSFYIKLTTKKIHSKFYINNEVITYDSDSVNTQDSSFKNIGKGFNFKITKQGKILSIDSITILNENNEINIKEIKKRLKYIFIPFSKQTISKKSFWISPDTLKDEIFNIYDKKYIFTDSTDSTFIIDNIAKVKTNKNKYKKVKDLFIFYNMNGNEKAKIVLNKKTCMIKELNIIQSSSGKSEVKYSKESGTIFSSPLKIENIISVKNIKINNNEN